MDSLLLPLTPGQLLDETDSCGVDLALVKPTETRQSTLHAYTKMEILCKGKDSLEELDENERELLAGRENGRDD